MKKLIICIVLCLCAGLFSLSALDGDEFNGHVDFMVTLEDLCNFVESQPEDVIRTVIVQDRIFLIVGTVTTRQVISADEADYVGELEIITGQWQGLEDVKIFRGVTRFSGPQFAGMIPARRSRTADPREIPVNVSVLQAVKLIGIRDFQGKPVPVFEGINIRILN